jgi:DNA-directed RNA polymerase subunit RPC12/RpoP
MEELKKCSKCKKELPKDNFTKNSQTKDGLEYRCKECRNKQSKKYYRNNKHYFVEWWSGYYKKNKKSENKRSSDKYKRYVKTIPDYNKNRYEKQKDYQKAYLYNYERIKRNEDENFRLAKALRSRLHDFLLGKNKSVATEKLIGCTSEEFHVYIENQFKPGMTWDNYGRHGWVIDHYWPVCEFDLTDAQQRLACFNFRNLQPLWYEENKKKGRISILEREAS